MADFLIILAVGLAVLLAVWVLISLWRWGRLP